MQQAIEEYFDKIANNWIIKMIIDKLIKLKKRKE
jgi:hypothetical protein